MAGEIFLLRVPRLARFLITAGRDIVVEIEPGVTDHDAAGFVLGSAFGILLHQRGALVLHGAAVAKDGRAIAICGASGAGKSTLAAALCRDGCAFVTDDICVVGLDANRRPVVLPDGRQLKLWKQSIDRLDLAQLRGEAVRESFEKYFIDPSDARGQPSPLAAIYVLREARPPFKAGIETPGTAGRRAGARLRSLSPGASRQDRKKTGNARACGRDARPRQDVPAHSPARVRASAGDGRGRASALGCARPMTVLRSDRLACVVSEIWQHLVSDFSGKPDGRGQGSSRYQQSG